MVDLLDPAYFAQCGSHGLSPLTVTCTTVLLVFFSLQNVSHLSIRIQTKKNTVASRRTNTTVLATHLPNFAVHLRNKTHSLDEK
jgi:hypothetical protein